LCTKTSLFRGSLATKKSPKNPRNTFCDAQTGAAKRTPRFVRFVETALRAGLSIKELIRGKTLREVIFFNARWHSVLIDVALISSREIVW